ncbi:MULTISPECIES: iron chaperone [Isoptericola]|uniref:DUF1801 domain-containing protein n=1 Tax=Isoptericola sediminis TaxID=2733572 RepID=A0A849JZM4_9MICO|nr:MULTISPECIES: DUF1801 domain-containing protein [Isoptericola]MDO8145036.1 DUF1801 domain-containing protein [Isoptericola sp. 178]MDO8148670.1 DUF1801 domain-containing protein [Isoptericola sp. b515]MDO8151384.1 DUF1801 domain-containing protein [Isoptericola sp. b408]NNU28732.1 DUF1801 domain-containing protein [Isoptericola sediminis]
MGQVTAYVAGLDEPDRSAVADVVARARRLVPEATEGVGYGMPALRYRDSPLLAVVARAHHVGVYPFSPAAIVALADRLADFRVTKGSIAFQPDHPLPGEVVDRLVTLRREEIDALRTRRPV